MMTVWRRTSATKTKSNSMEDDGRNRMTMTTVLRMTSETKIRFG